MAPFFAQKHGLEYSSLEAQPMIDEVARGVEAANAKLARVGRSRATKRFAS